MPSSPPKKKKSRFLIYGLVDPRTDGVRYIGRSSSGTKRPKQHRHPSRLPKDPTHKGRWLRALKRQGLSYRIRVLERVPSDELLDDAEKRWIVHGKEQGWQLTNLTGGGHGLYQHTFTKEHRERISKANKGRKLTEEQRHKLSEAAKRWKRTPEHMEKLRQSNIGRPQSEYQKRRVSEVHTGKIVSQKTCELISKARSIPVVDLTTGKVYPSGKVAEQELGLCPSSVSKVRTGRLKSIHGHRFAYATKI